MNKEFIAYQEKLNNNRKAMVEKFYDGLVKYNIDLRKIDKLIIARKEGVVSTNNTITEEKNGVREEIYSAVGSSYGKTEILRGKLKRRIIDEELVVTITYKREGEFKITETWEIDCTNIK